MPPPPSKLSSAELKVALLIAAVQFVNILDFVMVMPMGPDFAKGLGIPMSALGKIGGSYTAAAAVSGFVASFFLDRFDRRRALAVAMVGLVSGTAMGGFARGLGSLMAARIVAGAFGGPATSLSFSIIADAVPPERRGKAMGIVMSAFSMASVLGLGAGLVLAMVGGWQAPFFAVAGMGLFIAAGAVFLLPPMRAHLDGPRQAHPRFRELLGRSDVLLSYTMTALVMAAGFIIIPNISAFVQMNLGFPRERLQWLYVAGGVVSFVSTNAVGRLVDRYGSFRTGTLGAVLLSLAVFLGFAQYQPSSGLPVVRASEALVRWASPVGGALGHVGVTGPQLPVFLLFMGFMLAMSFRNVSYNTLTSKVPKANERARFMSLQSCVQHLASASGAFLSSKLLIDLPDHSLGGMPRIAWISIGMSALLPILLWVVEARVRRNAEGVRVKAAVPASALPGAADS